MTTTTKTKTATPKTAKDAHAHVEDAALRAAQQTDTITSMALGEIIHQGDIYLVRVADQTLPSDGDLTSAGRKLAPGNNPGARHVIDPDADVTVYASGNENALRAVQPSVAEHALLGPLVVARSAMTLMHPEHGHRVCPAGTYQTMYQVDAMTMRRVLD